VKKLDRLFLPLNTIWHTLFLSGEKTWELRAYGKRFNEKSCAIGRAVEIRRGYQYDPYLGKVDGHLIVKSWSDIPDHIKEKIIPSEVADDPVVIGFLDGFLSKYDNKNGLIAIKIVDLRPMIPDDERND
jgi:hypothetical protein